MLLKNSTLAATLAVLRSGAFFAQQTRSEKKAFMARRLIAVTSLALACLVGCSTNAASTANNSGAGTSAQTSLAITQQPSNATVADGQTTSISTLR